MKFFNGVLGVVFVVIPAILFWADCWSGESSVKQKYERVFADFGFDDEVPNTHEGLIKAFNENKISRNDYAREIEKLQRQLKRESKKAEKKLKKELK